MISIVANKAKLVKNKNMLEFIPYLKHFHAIVTFFSVGVNVNENVCGVGWLPFVFELSVELFVS